MLIPVPLFFLSAVPPKVEEAFKTGKYVPYNALNHAARVKAANGEETLVFSANGLVAKSLDRAGEREISVLDWQASARAAEERTRAHHEGRRAEGLAAHHAIVLRITSLHSWEIAVAYDIRQRELIALHPTHDLSKLNHDVLSVVTTQMLANRAAIAKPAPPSSGSFLPLKRSAPADSSTAAPRKRFRSYCFRCGRSGHLPGECTEGTTVTGRGCAGILAGGASKHALQGPGGKSFCFRFAKSSTCNYGAACTGFHGCSICGNTAHGAGKCNSAN